ncbi:hypothetical protein DRF58_09320 [Epilithonimonas hispanica]|uniref:Uncharacterized protein n=1 Tax=Epilithonimonas hispanica TaxID=358687 RepID=A0A3D9CXS2_9FLAO|nr:hypothetical protein DRF58_09320 [Epilithonimonas hispanica]
MGAYIRTPFPLFSIIAKEEKQSVELLSIRNVRKRAPLSSGRAAQNRNICHHIKTFHIILVFLFLKKIKNV